MNTVVDGKPWERVPDCGYFRNVLGSMIKFDSNARRDATTIVRFGLGGEGVRPNYQIEAPGRVLAISSINHEADSKAPGGRYADQELSAECFTLQGVQGLLKQCLDRKSGKE